MLREQHSIRKSSNIRFDAIGLRLYSEHCSAGCAANTVNTSTEKRLLGEINRLLDFCQATVDPDVVWAKLSAMAEGAKLATKQFWGD